MTIDFFSMTHSIPGSSWRSHEDSCRVQLLHTGDFKLDQTPIDGVQAQLRLLLPSFASEAVLDLLLSDSTNANRPWYARQSEASVGADPLVYEVIKNANGPRLRGVVLQPHPPPCSRCADASVAV